MAAPERFDHRGWKRNLTFSACCSTKCMCRPSRLNTSITFRPIIAFRRRSRLMGGVHSGHRDGRPGLYQARLTPPWLMLATAVFAASLLGIFTRPIGSLATVWPANAVFLGLLLRFEKTSTFAGWVAAFCAYLAADLLTGASLEKTVILSGANMAGVGAAYLVCYRLPEDIKRLRHPSSMLYLALAAVAGSVAAGLVGAIANPILFDSSSLKGSFSGSRPNSSTTLPFFRSFSPFPTEDNPTDFSQASVPSSTRLNSLLPFPC